MFIKIKEYLLNLWNEKRYGMLIFLLIISALGIVITIQLFAIFVSFIAKKFDLILLLGTICFVSYWYLKSKNDRLPKEKTKSDNCFIEEELHENNYILLRKCLFQLLEDSADILNLKKSRVSELDSPSKIIVKGNLYTYQYIVLKKGDIDCKTIENVLQQRINQKLENFEFEGITQTKHIWNGFNYPIIKLHSVKDTGSYIQIELVFTSDKYLELMNARKNLIANEPYNKNEFYDKDF